MGAISSKPKTTASADSRVPAGSAVSAPVPDGSLPAASTASEDQSEIASESRAASVELSPDPCFVIDVAGRLRYANPAAEQLLGWAVDERLGGSVLDLVHPDDRPLALSSLDAVQGKAVGTPIEIRVRDADDRWHWLEVIGRDCTNDSTVGGVMCTARDLTKRRMWEVATGDVTRFQQVVQHAAAIVMLLDMDGTVIGINGAFTRLLGHDPSRVVGRALVRFASSGHERVLANAIAEASSARLVSVEAPMAASLALAGTTAGLQSRHRQTVNLRVVR